MKIKLDLYYIVLIIFISISIGCIFNFVSDKGIPFIKKNIELKSLDDTTNISATDIEPKTITIEQTLGFYKSKDKIFIDARDQWDYSEGHIKDAINIPEYKFVESDLNKFDFSITDTIVIYCGDDDCDTSKRLAINLSKLGYKNIFVYQGGWDEWLKMDLPVER